VCIGKPSCLALSSAYCRTWASPSLVRKIVLVGGARGGGWLFREGRLIGEGKVVREGHVGASHS
jgi:hypothetical protein